MSTKESVSRIEFWRESQAASASRPKAAEVGGPGAVYLSYDVFLGLTLLGGFFGLDHLYLRSPLTALAKFVVNLVGFGVWWLYDIGQALFQRDVVRIFGLSVPGLGPQGLAAGVLAQPVPDQKHLRFFTYALALVAGGLFGVDSFLLGDHKTGLLQLLALVSLLFAPLAIAHWLYKLFRFATDTKGVVNEHAEYFGAPESSLSESLFSHLPFLGALFSPLETLQSLLGNAVEPVTKTVDGVVKLGEDTVKTVDDSVQLARNVVSKGSNIVEQVTKTVDTVAKAASQSSQVIPGVSLYSSITPEAVAAKTGGALPDDLNVLHYVVLGTIATLVLGGFYRIFSSRPVAEADDSPPEPRVFRVPDSKGRAA